MYDTILTRKNRRKICLALREQVLRRFFRVFSFLLYFVDIQCNMQVFCTFSFLGSVEKRAKCLGRQSILHPHLDNLASSLRLSCTAKHSDRHRESHKMAHQSLFSLSHNTILVWLQACKKVSVIVSSDMIVAHSRNPVCVSS